jgi:hypothetical protein
MLIYKALYFSAFCQKEIHPLTLQFIGKVRGQAIRF